MSLLWLEGFEWLGNSVGSTISATVSAYKYAYTFGTLYLRDGRTGGYAVEGSYGNNVLARSPVFPVTADTYVAGFGMYPYNSSGGTGDMPLFTFRKGSSYSGIQLRYRKPENELVALYRGSTPAGITARANLAQATWNYVEVKVKDAVDGSIEVRVNGYEVLILTGIDTTTSNGVGYDNFELQFSYNNFYPVRIDDFYFLNTAGDTNNDWLGNVQVRSKLPSSDGDLAEWGLSAGADHYALVDDAPPTADTDYTTADGTVSDLFGYGAAPDLGSIAGIQVNSVAKEMATAVVPMMKNLVKSNGTVYEQTVPAITTGYKNLYNINETDPDTAAAWTLTNLNAAQFGIKRV